MAVINMYEKITLCLLIVLVIVRSEEVSTANNAEIADLSNLRLSTVLPYNDENLKKDNSKRSLLLLMPLSQTRNEHEKEAVKKTKRCGTQRRKNKFLLLSTKKDSNKIKTIDKNINVGISKQNLDDHIIKDAKYLGKSAAKRMITEGHKDEMLLQALKENLNAEDVIINIKSQEKPKKCNSKKYICHCQEENCFSSSSKKSSSRMLGSKIDKPERTNRRLTNHKNTKPDILQQKSPILYHENPHELPLPNPIDHFLIQPYQEKINIPSVPVLYGIIPDILPHIVENERKSVGIPFTSFERLNYLVGNNQYQPIIHQKPYVCSAITEEHQVKGSMSTTSPSINYVDATTIRETTNNLESTSNLIGQTEENQEHFPELTTGIPNVDLSHSETETNLPLNYLTEKSNTIRSSNLNEVTSKSEDFTEQTERNPDNNFSKLMTFSTDYADKSNAPSFIYDGTNDGKFINMEECIQLFGRDVCVLRATSPKMLAKQAQENNLNKYSTIRIPEYVTQMSARKETTLNNINYSDKPKITDPYFASESSTNGINKSNINLNEYLESTSAKSNADVDKAFPHEFHRDPESIGQISEPDVNYDKNKSFSTVKSTPVKKLIDPTINETAKAEKNKLLGKSKSHTTKLLLNPNDKEITNSTSGEKFLYSTPSHKSSSDEDTNNLKINHQVTNTNSNSSTSPKEETTVTSHDSKIGYNSKEQNRDDLKESNTDVYSEKKISQEHFKEDTTTTSSNSKTGYNFEEITKKEIIGIEPSVHPGEISQERSTTMQYFDDKKSSNLNHKDIINNVEELVDSSTSKLPFCDNTLLLNSIRKVINDFALDSRLTKTKDLNENILQTQGKNLLPEILQVPKLKNILSIPQIENTIVEKVKDVLSYVTAIPRRDFTNNWSHGVIKNTLRNILDALSGFHHKLPPMTLEEHQFKNGQWRTNLVTLAPILNQKLSKRIPENLQESITDLLSSPAIASQIDQHIVRNMIVQSVKNSLTNDGDDKMDDSIIHVLNDVLQTLKNSKDINTLESNQVISDEEDMDMNFSQDIPTSNYEIGINIDNSTLNNKQNLDIKKDKMDSEKITDYQKAKTLENNANILTTSELSHLLQLSEEEEERTDKAIAKIKENIRDFEQIKKIDMQDNAEKKLVEPKITYHKAILQNNSNVLAILEPDSTGTEQNINNHRIGESIKDTTITNFIQETSPNYAQVSDNIMLENTARSKDVGVKHTLSEKTLTTSTEIDPLIILERIKFNLPPTKYYSPEILKYVTSRIDDNNVESTTASTNFIQETSSNHAQDSMILQNITETNHEDEMEYPLTTTSANLISSTNVEYKDYKPKMIALTGENILESQQNSQQQNFTEGNIIKIHEVTTEIQRTYAKTTYFKAGPFSDGSPRISSSSLACETTDMCVNNSDKEIKNNDKENNNSNMGDDNNNLIADKINTDNVIKAEEVIVPSSKLSAKNDTDPPQLFRSSIVPDDISELQKSQLYYISDGMKLPLEIKRLEDGSYALSISKNICEKILTRKCPCCVPLQGYVVRSLKNHQQEDMHATTSTTTEKKDQENMYVNNIKRDYQSVQPFNTMITSMITRRSALRTQKSKEEEKEEEKINAHHSWKQNDNLTIILPVVDFAKKYNLSLDNNEEKIPFNEARLQIKMQNYDKSLMKSGKISEYDQSMEKNLNNYLDIKKNRLLGDSSIINKIQDLVNVREKKNIPNMNFPTFPIAQKIFNLKKNFEEFEVQKANAEMNQSEIVQGSKSREVRTANDIPNMNIVQKIISNSENRERANPVFKEINISERSKSKEEMKWDRLLDIAGNTKVFRKEEAMELVDNESNVPEIRNFKENIEKPYRYQRNTNDVATKRTELVKSMLYWLKDLFVSK